MYRYVSKVNLPPQTAGTLTQSKAKDTAGANVCTLTPTHSHPHARTHTHTHIHTHLVKTGELLVLEQFLFALKLPLAQEAGKLTPVSVGGVSVRTGWQACVCHSHAGRKEAKGRKEGRGGKRREGSGGGGRGGEMKKGGGGDGMGRRDERGRWR